MERDGPLLDSNKQLNFAVVWIYKIWKAQAALVLMNNDNLVPLKQLFTQRAPGGSFSAEHNSSLRSRATAGRGGRQIQVNAFSCLLNKILALISARKNPMLQNFGFIFSLEHQTCNLCSSFARFPPKDQTLDLRIPCPFTISVLVTHSSVNLERASTIKNNSENEKTHLCYSTSNDGTPKYLTGTGQPSVVTSYGQSLNHIDHHIYNVQPTNCNDQKLLKPLPRPPTTYLIINCHSKSMNK